ncbi:hypothetical protein QBC34DRAFT_407043 [Podospora aff. communis PSN243]|uniref:Uncharacterized protein n=1 Tax=Podospora aff. communis PSN243 TaxID=3040156 RepID=A0AAV9GJC3_9PEZI|nr:hypothetical protein QBC34DRAFT_407043 [Podospora aff. communis PSN243]
MPRPKRSRVARSRPAAAPAQAHRSSTTPPAMAPLSSKLPNPPSSDIYDVSDREKEKQEMRARAAGARRELHADSEQTKALETSKRRRDEAMDRLDNITSTTRPADSGSAEDRVDSPEIEYSRKESVSMAAGFRPARLTDASGLDLDDSVFANLDDSLDDTLDADTTHNTHQTRSTDTSSFNVGMFRRRPRQSSIVGKDDAPIRPSSRGPNTPSISSHLNLGRFKRRQREPSILGTAQKDRAPRPQSQMSNYGSVMGDDSGPEDESTPLDKTKRHSGAAQERESSPSLPTRKRKSLEEQTGREKRLALDNDAEEEVIHQSIEVDSTQSGSDSLSDPSSTPVRDSDPDMAPPASSDSSSNGSPIVWPPLESLAHRTYARQRPAAKTPEPHGDAASDISSPPSLTHSPNYRPAPKTRAKRKPVTARPPKVTTADLTSLLPRRRHPHRGGSPASGDEDPYDLDSSNVDQDELSYVDSRTAAAKRKRLAQTSTNKNAKGTKNTVTPAETTSRRKSRVYGRNSDKENEDDEETEGEQVAVELGSEAEEENMPSSETSQMMEARIGTELKNAVKKFKEVDQWELSFEVVEKSSSPPPDVVPPAEGEEIEDEEIGGEGVEGDEARVEEGNMGEAALEIVVEG